MDGEDACKDNVTFALCSSSPSLSYQ